MKRFGGLEIPHEFGHVATPIGVPCAHCGIAIQREQSGYVIDGAPWHRGCLLSALLTEPSPGTVDEEVFV